MRARTSFLIFFATCTMASCVSMQPRRTPEGQATSTPVEHIRVHLTTGEEFDLYDATIRADSIIGRTRLVLEAPLQAVATADVAEIREPRVSTLRTAALSVLVLAGLLVTAVLVTFAALFSPRS